MEDHAEDAVRVGVVPTVDVTAAVGQVDLKAQISTLLFLGIAKPTVHIRPGNFDLICNR